MASVNIIAGYRSQSWYVGGNFTWKPLLKYAVDRFATFNIWERLLVLLLLVSIRSPLSWKKKLLSSGRTAFQETLRTIDKPLDLTVFLELNTYLGVHKCYFGGTPEALQCPELQRLSMLQHALPRLSMAVTCLAGGMHNHDMPTRSLPGEQDVGEPP